jgi:hypothetical protein
MRDRRPLRCPSLAAQDAGSWITRRNEHGRNLAAGTAQMGLDDLKYEAR